MRRCILGALIAAATGTGFADVAGAQTDGSPGAGTAMVVPEGTEAGQYENYAYTCKGNPVKRRMPDKEGPYEIRYLSGGSRNTLDSLPITVTGVEVSLEATPTAAACSVSTVTWSDPDNKNDYISIAKSGSPDNKHATYAYTRNGSPARLKTPAESGSYELRYVMGRSKHVLTRMALTVD